MADRHQTHAYPLRLPDELKARVVQAAADNGRSFNSEVAARLQDSFAQPKGLSSELSGLAVSIGYLMGEVRHLRQTAMIQAETVRIFEEYRLAVRAKQGAGATEIKRAESDAMRARAALNSTLQSLQTAEAERDRCSREMMVLNGHAQGADTGLPLPSEVGEIARLQRLLAELPTPIEAAEPPLQQPTPGNAPEHTHMLDVHGLTPLPRPHSLQELLREARRLEQPATEDPPEPPKRRMRLGAGKK